ncbi:flp pilus-assembly TadE/G-like family protein [Solwaraspora sp. WMMD406]|uniref:Rv3654c family TadE-like protein n=1 Tax=Solwaraspora sp. WMMD406 TaxID=3016095 RepID=UPI002417541C|nr:Rv3654c family TadE-like protein [Solwaraspora sp. WMMD406]MDG4763391.1 flp pilus-assembly TadE/G-like family protein [Solwaraspora sp. WMMD406]
MSRRTAGRQRRLTDCGQRGSASLWLLTVGLVVVLAGAAGAFVAAAHLARHQAGTAADLAALAGAARIFDGPTAACARATELAMLNHGRLVRCVTHGLEITVTVEVPVVGPPGTDRVATAYARAGPVQG